MDSSVINYIISGIIIGFIALERAWKLIGKSNLYKNKKAHTNPGELPCREHAERLASLEAKLDAVHEDIKELKEN